jgi:uncharacterized protein (TIGR02246 family)
MPRRLSAALVIGIVISSSSLLAQTPTSPEEAAVRQRLSAYAEARSRRDAAAEARCYTTDGDFRSSVGPFVSGRDAIEKQLTVNDPGYRFSLTVTKLRVLAPQVAMVDADVVAGPEGRTVKLLGSYVMVREGSDWLIAAARVAPTPAPRTPAP